MSKYISRVCYVVCYRDPNYTRTNSLINALSLVDGIELLVIKNKFKGVLRYIEVPVRLLITRLRFRPDTFIVGFRADEIFWALYPAMIGKKIVFDEFINLHDWLVDEHKKLKKGSFAVKAADTYMRLVMRLCKVILTDTVAHAKLTSLTYAIPAGKILSIPVGADEKVFYPRNSARGNGSKFEVFFYGTALPLHGIEVILEAANKISAKNKNIHFTLVGGKGDPKFLKKLRDYISNNGLEETVSSEPWVDYELLPDRIAAADICLGGPFGGTGQAKRVISGKTYQFLAMAKPTVIGQIEGTIEFVDKVNCILVKQASANDLTRAIEWSFYNRAKLPQISQAGRELYRNRYSANAIAVKLRQVL